MDLLRAVEILLARKTITEDDFKFRTGISLDHMKMCEKKGRAYRMDTVQQIAQVFGLSVSALMLVAENPEYYADLFSRKD